jgi:hypothetical protein
LAVILLAAMVYGGDYVTVRYRIPRSRSPFATVTVQRSYAVTKKNGEPDFYFDPPQEKTCVRSLFPHLGYVPCWYLSRHRNQQTNM